MNLASLQPRRLASALLVAGVVFVTAAPSALADAWWRDLPSNAQHATRLPAPVSLGHGHHVWNLLRDEPRTTAPFNVPR